MKIAVCIKQVPVVSALQFDPETKTLKREGVRSEVSAFDVRALVKAVELRDAHGGDVTVMTMGPPQARDALVECLALGADRGVHLSDTAFAGADTLATAQALAAALKREPYDLILCGRNSVDAETGQVGPEVAELLDLPQVTGVRSVSVDEGGRSITAERETDDGTETVQAPLPALVTAAEDLAPERFAGKAQRAAAREKPIETLAASDLSSSADLFGAAGSPTWVLGLSAVQVDRKQVVIEAEDADSAADQLVRRLLDDGLFGTWKMSSQTSSAAAPSPRVARQGSKDVLVVSEPTAGPVRSVTLELLSKARQLQAALGGTVGCLTLGACPEEQASVLSAHGAQRIFAVAGKARDLSATAPCTAILTEILRRHRPGVVLLPSTAFGRDVAPRMAARLSLGLTGDCIDLDIDEEGRLLQHKPAFGGSVVALIASRTQPEIATVRPGMLGIGEARQDGHAEIVAIDAPAVAGAVRALGRQETAEASEALAHADVVIGVGKGIGGPENLTVIESLARPLDAALCATRDVTDAGWLPKQYQVGMTGRAIAPSLYIAVAVRGAFEHTVGIRRAGLVVAINKSAKAPIFKVADYGIVGEYETIVPLLTQRLTAAREERRAT